MSESPLAARILVAIPTLNEQAHIETCIRSLIEGDAAARNAAFVVADGGSADDTRAIVAKLAGEFPNVRLLDNPRRIQSAAINRAAQEGRGLYDILIRCDAHAAYPKGFISALAAAMARTGADSVVIPMDAVGEGCFQRAAAWIVDTPLGSGGSAHRGGKRSAYVDHGHHAAFRLERFLSLGGYDETFTHNEDAEYDRRVLDAGGKIWLDADIRISYVPRDTPEGLWKQYRNYGRGRARMLMKHRQRPAPRQMIPVANLLLLALSALLAPFAPLLAGFWPALYLTLLVGSSLGVMVWKRSLCGAWAGVALAIMHNAWALGFIEAVLTRRGKPAPASPQTSGERSL